MSLLKKLHPKILGNFHHFQPSLLRKIVKMWSALVSEDLEGNTSLIVTNCEVWVCEGHRSVVIFLLSLWPVSVSVTRRGERLDGSSVGLRLGNIFTQMIRNYTIQLLG